MRKKKVQPNSRRRTLRLPDLGTLSRFKQNLGHPVNDLFDLRMETQQTKCEESVTATGASEGVESPFGEGVDCRHGRSDHEPASDTAPILIPTNRLGRVRKAIARTVFDGALMRELQEVMQEAKQKANQIEDPAHVWELERYLTQRRKDIDRRYEFRSSRLTQVFGQPLWEHRIRTTVQLRRAQDQSDPLLRRSFVGGRSLTDSKRYRLLIRATLGSIIRQTYSQS